jgi:hypothetical protein
MNKILGFLLLLLLGWVVSFAFGNIILTVVICLVAGILLFRKKKAKAPQIVQPSRPQAGAIRKEYQPQEILDKFKRLQAGDKANYMSIMHNTVISDNQGRYWSLGVIDLKWHRFENNIWVKDEPSGPLKMARRSNASYA